MKRFGIAGTGGQCLMLPPDKPLEEIPVALYHWGGVIVNMSVALLAFVVWYVVEDPSPLLAQFLVMMCFAGVSLDCSMASHSRGELLMMQPMYV